MQCYSPEDTRSAGRFLRWSSIANRYVSVTLYIWTEISRCDIIAIDVILSTHHHQSDIFRGSTTCNDAAGRLPSCLARTPPGPVVEARADRSSRCLRARGWRPLKATFPVTR